MTAGLAYALRRVATALAGYIVILRGKTFNIGDRIVLGGVRGDVIGLGFLQTTIMEMGQPPSVQSADPAMGVEARQYSGPIVTVANAKIFDDAVFNYTRDFSFIWEELHIPIKLVRRETATGQQTELTGWYAQPVQLSPDEHSLYRSDAKPGDPLRDWRRLETTSV